MKHFFSFLVLTFLGAINLHAQQAFTDTVSVFAYNINNFGFASTKSCPTEGSTLKPGYIRTILRYQNAPDIVSFEKFNATPTTLASDSMQKYIMDSVCKGCYANTTYTNVSGYSKVNTLFYKTAKFGYLGTTGIYTADNSISDINLHKLYYKSPSLATTKDTVFLSVIVVHDASGSSSTSQRGTEIGGAMTWLSTHVTTPGNYIFMGDFNVQTSTETCFQDMIAPKDTMVRFYEPTNQLGNWAGSPTSFAKYLTQSTRTSDPGDCASTNAMTTWFDHIMCTDPIMRGTKNMQYIPNSFQVVGQDGLHTNGALTDAPTDTIVPATVLNALYQMSEHLPVQLKLAINIPAALPIGFEYFKASIQDNKPFLQWEDNNNGAANAFQIERSEDGTNFTAINSVEATTNNSYAFSDISAAGYNPFYYRIKEVLKTGEFLYSNVVVVRINKNISEVTISPNPVRDNLTLSLQSNYTTKADVRIINSLGQTCISQKAQLQSGANSLPINNLSTLAKGVYIINVQAADNMESKLFIKE